MTLRAQIASLPLVIAAVVVVGCSGGTEIRTVAWDEVTVGEDGATVTVRYFAGSCQEFHDVGFREDGDEVVLTLRVAEPSGDCPADSVSATEVVDVPPGIVVEGRTIVDGAGSE